MRIAAQPGAVNLASTDLRDTDILTVATAAQPFAQATLGEIKRFFGLLPTSAPYREITTGASVVMTEDDFALGIDKSPASPTAVTLPPISVIGQMARVLDAGVNIDGSSIISVSGEGAATINKDGTPLEMEAPGACTTFQATSLTNWAIVF